jgi:2,4-didehydro-3-deoxy-L-rhamnonate hydrolase
MKLIRYGALDNEKPGIELDGVRYDVSSFVDDYNEKFFTTDGITRLAAWIESNKNSLTKIEENSRWAEPVARPSKLLCIGLNYVKHAKEAGMEIPKEPIIFFKSTTAIVGPFDDVIIPKGSEKTDYEVELAFVIGKKASYVSEAEAMDYVAGYLLHNDISERAFQLERGGQWTKGKGCDTFAPLGPYFVTKDEIADPNKLDIWLKLNGTVMQDSDTSDMIFDVPFIISYVSQFMTLLPGDIISTGTPFGVGMGLKPQKYLVPGDVMELGIPGLGISRQKLVAYK